MLRTYTKYYLYDVQRLLATLFDYLLKDVKLTPKELQDMLLTSSYTKLIEQFNPSIVSGKSGVEVANLMLTECMPNKQIVNQTLPIQRSAYFWAGFVLAYYIWDKRISFEKIFEFSSIEEVLDMYKLYHEYDVTNFVDAMEEKRKERTRKITNLKKYRLLNNLSQSQLAKLSGVALRSIQLYEQRVNDIDKGQANTLYRLSEALNCSIEDLLENPFDSK